MNQQELLEWAERTALDIKENDTFPIEEKRRMLGHMINKEWTQLGLIVVHRAMADWTSDEERNEFLRDHYDLPGRLYEKAYEYDLENDQVTGYRGLFQLSDLQYMFVLDIAEVWRLSRDT